MSLRRSIWLSLLTILAILGISLTNLSPAAIAHASNLEPKLKNCISQPIVSGNLTLNICTSKTHYKSGEIVNISILLGNTGQSSLKMSSITDGVFITDPNGKSVMRLVGFECFGSLGNCVLPAESTRDLSVQWNTSDTFTAATVSGLYKIDVGLTACPTTGSCIETVNSQLAVRITLTPLEIPPKFR